MTDPTHEVPDAAADPTPADQAGPADTSGEAAPRKPSPRVGQPASAVLGLLSKLAGHEGEPLEVRLHAARGLNIRVTFAEITTLARWGVALHGIPDADLVQLVRYRRREDDLGITITEVPVRSWGWVLNLVHIEHHDTGGTS